MGLGFLAFLRSPFGRLFSEVTVIVLAVGGIYMYGHHQGAVVGGESAKAQQVEADAKQYEAEKKAHDQDNQTAAQQQALLAAKVEAAAAQMQQLAKTEAVLEQQRISAQSQIAGMSDTKVLADLVARLGVRPAGDTSGTLSPEETRKMDAIAADYSSVKTELSNVQAQLQATSAKADAAAQQFAACQAQEAKTETYATALEGYYVTAYNAVPKKRNILLTILTFGLAGKVKRLPLPTPEALKAARAPQTR